MAAARQTPLTCSGHTRPVVDLCYSPLTPDGFFLISACKDGKPMLRQGKTGDWLGTFTGHKGAVWGATLNNKALLAATGAADFTAKVWDAITGEEKVSFNHPHIVKAVDFSKDSASLLTGCNDKTVRMYSVEKPDTAPLELKGHTTSIKKALFMPQESIVVSGGDDKAIRVWDTREGGKETKTVAVDAPITSIEVAQDDQTLVVTYGTTVAFYDAKTIELKKAKKMASPVYTATLHPNNTSFVWGGADNLIHIVDYETCEQKEEYKGHFGPVHCARFSPDGEIYASGSEDGTVRLWQTNVGTEYGLWRFSKAEGEKEES